MFNRLEKERQSLSDKVDHLESERQQLSGTVEEVKKLCREADEKYAAVEEERDRLNEQLQEHGGLNKTLKLELNMYNTMAEQQKAPQGNNSKLELSMYNTMAEQQKAPQGNNSKLELCMYNTMVEQQKTPQGNNSKRSACIIPWLNSRKHHNVTILN